ncbi:MAG: leucyl aminopeptidase [Actinomycetia bacterium]|nr:leucyl aminopeptidase [Actinomycetes bacterium]MCP3910350.1 leucyl aminopeptidase [Actinomycetes bacterium]
MSPTFNLATRLPRTVKALDVPAFSGALDDAGFDDATRAWLDRRGFEGNLGQWHAVPRADGVLQVVVGLGSADDFTSAKLRRAAALVAKAASKEKVLVTQLVDVAATRIDPSDAAQAVAEGFTLALYHFSDYKSRSTSPQLGRVSVLGGGGATTRAALVKGAAIGDAVCTARDLVNTPGGDLTPVELARRARALARKHGLQVRIMDQKAIREAKLGGLLGVNRGSEQAPRFIKLTYKPEGRSRGKVALVGKGITFDSGGLSIKTGQGMMTMKTDMAGAAAVIGAMEAIAQVGPPVEVTAYVAATDNMTGGDATRPGDVLTLRNGKTIEVLNTDAEGRLILADALCLASEDKPDAIVDLATLTGACMVALGPRIAGAMGNSEGWIGQLQTAAERTGERIWPLPLPDDYRKMVDSTIADMKNIGGPYGGALTAGIILSEFVDEGIAWVHLDIAGPSSTDAEDGETLKGGTGFGVRLLVDAIEQFSPLSVTKS